MERKIGDTFIYKGVVYIVENEVNLCNECSFLSNPYDCNNSRNTRGMCYACLRKDNKKVIFKKVK